MSEDTSQSQKEIEIDLSSTEKVTLESKSKTKLKKIVFTDGILSQMLLDFAAAKPNETISWLSGKVEGDVGHVLRYWKTELEHADFVSAETKPEWLIKFSNDLAKDYPDHNLVIEAHVHPIGSSMSSVDRNSLYSLTEWSDDVYFCMIACDIPLGVYTVYNQNMIQVSWEVEVMGCKTEEKPLEAQTLTTTSKTSWAKKIMEILKVR